MYEHAGPAAARAYYDATLLGLEQIRTFVREHGVDCELEENGSLQLATEEVHLAEMEGHARRLGELGVPASMVGAAELRRSLRSERFVGGLRLPGHAILNPSKLALGMRRTLESLGVVVSERSKLLRLEPGATVRLITEFAEIEAPRVVMTQLGGMILARLVAGDVDPLTKLAIVDRPLSWLGVEPVRSAAVRLPGWALEGLGSNPVR